MYRYLTCLTLIVDELNRLGTLRVQIVAEHAAGDSSARIRNIARQIRIACKRAQQVRYQAFIQQVVRIHFFSLLFFFGRVCVIFVYSIPLSNVLIYGCVCCSYYLLKPTTMKIQHSFI